MVASVLKLNLLDRVTPLSRELDLVSELFHRINRVLPADQSLLTIPPTCKASEAIEMMAEHGYSQLPVVSNGTVLGVFSYRSFAQNAARADIEDLNQQRVAPGELSVGEYLEQFEFARVTDDMPKVFDPIDRDNGILVGASENLIGVLTPMDFLKYLYQIASPFVALSEIELSLRMLIRLALTSDQIVTAAKICLASAYGGTDKVPTLLERMTFDNYTALVSFKDNWMKLEPVFGSPRLRVHAKLKQLNGIRNDVFHFRREITADDRKTLIAHRAWLLSRVQLAQAIGCSETGS
jgi:predicted transcriptional regulator